MLFNLHAIELFYEASILTETMFVLVLSVALLVIRRMIERPSPAMAAVVGAAMQRATLTRPVAQWYVFGSSRRGAAGDALAALCAQRLVRACVIGGDYAAIALPWMAINQREFGFFESLGHGLGLFIRAIRSQSAAAASVTGYPDVQRALRFAYSTGRAPEGFVHADLKAWGYSMHQVDEAMYGYALEAIGEQPGQFCRQHRQAVGDSTGRESRRRAHLPGAVRRIPLQRADGWLPAPALSQCAARALARGAPHR